MKLFRSLALIAGLLLILGISVWLDNSNPSDTPSPSGSHISSTTETDAPSLKGMTIVNFGDSIFGNYKAPTDISSYLSTYTGATTYNVGFGGCRMGQHPNQYNCFSMYNLAYAIANNDWTLQDETMARTDWTPHSTFANHLATLKAIDFNEVDIITIAYGTNDFTGENAISSADPYDTTTYNGALRYSIETIQAAYPNVKIVLCTQTYRFWLDKENDNAFLYDSTTYARAEQMLTDFVQATKDIAAEYGLCCIDNYTGSGICADNRADCFSATDGTHPNETGRQMIAEYMASVLLEKFA